MFKQFGAGTNSYDPQNFDPDFSNATGSGAGSEVIAAQPGNKMQVNLTLNNPTLQELTFELFGSIDSFVNQQKTQYQKGNYLYIPLLSREGIQATEAGTGGTIGWNKNGDLEIRGKDDNTPTADPVATVACGEIPYRSFFEASAIKPFTVAWLRETVTTDDQIDKNIVWFQRTYSGGRKENRISPRAFFRPNQYQPLTIDINTTFNIQADTGIQMNVLPGESVRLAMFINFWTNQKL